MNKIESAFVQFLSQRDKDGMRRTLPAIDTAGPRYLQSADQTYLNFSSNDYLGLSQNPDLTKAAQHAYETYGNGSGASRLVTGHNQLFTMLEDRLAAFKGREAAFIMASGFQANASILPALFDKDVHGQNPLVFTDKFIHASMHLGCAAAGISQIRFRHNDMNHLETLLKKHTDNPAPKFILTESVFSMDGDRAPLDDIDRLAKRYGCFTIVDEAHSTGVFGDHGKGLAHKADLVIGTFSKAFGCFGAYVSCSETIKSYLINKCAGFIYATALPPGIIASIDAALRMMPSLDRERAHLKDISEQFRKGVQALGYDTYNSTTQIIPIKVGDAKEALSLSSMLRDQKIWVNAIRPPTVPMGESRLRFSLSAAHQESDIDAVLFYLSDLQSSKAA